MRATITLLAICLVYGLQGQVQDFDLTTFKTPDTEFQRLRLSPSASFFRNNDNFQSDNDLRLVLFGNYDKLLLTRKKNSISSAFSNFSFFNDDDSSNLELFASFSNLSQYYFQPKRFFELDYGLSANYDRFSSDGNSNNSTTLSVGVAPKIGFGRIENVSNARHSGVILKILEKEGLLKKTPSQEDMYLMAEEMTRIKNQRVIDFRFEDIYEFETMINFLVENGFVDPSDYKFFSVFQDAWRFEDFTIRQHGQNILIGTDSDITYSNSSGGSGSTFHRHLLDGEFIKEIARNNLSLIHI